MSNKSNKVNVWFPDESYSSVETRTEYQMGTVLVSTNDVFTMRSPVWLLPSQ